MMMMQFLYLIPGDFGIGPINLSNFLLLFSISWCFYILYKYQKYKNKYQNLTIIFVFTSLILTSTYQSYVLYGQSIYMGLNAQKFLLTSLILYFPIVKLLKMGKITLSDIKSVIYVSGIVQIIIYFVQYFIGPNHVFLNVYYNTYLNGSMRIYGSGMLVTFLFYFCINDFFNRVHRIRSLLMLALYFSYLILINQGRTALITAAATLIFGLIIWKTKSVQRIIIYVLLLIVITECFNSLYFQNVISTINDPEQYSTYTVRLDGQEFYHDVLKNHPILGGGYVNSDWLPAVQGSGMNLGYYTDDNGMYGFLFRYGWLGIVLPVLLFSTLIIGGIKQYKNINQYIVLLAVFKIFVGIMTNSAWFNGYDFFGSVLLLIFSCESSFNNSSKKYKEYIFRKISA